MECFIALPSEGPPLLSVSNKECFQIGHIFCDPNWGIGGGGTIILSMALEDSQIYTNRGTQLAWGTEKIFDKHSFSSHKIFQETVLLV